MVASPPRAEAARAVQTYGNYIAGEWRPAASGETMENRNPANRDEIVGLFASSGADDVDAAIAAAEEAFRTWRFSSPMTRASILHKAANILESRIPEVGRELTREEGKTLKEGIGETTRAVQILRYFAGEAQQPSGEHYPSVSPHTLLYTTREPLGVVAVVTPWNFPIAIPA
jgi:alpha-ketoglutaric semialdehyde dehydrogenase